MKKPRILLVEDEPADVVATKLAFKGTYIDIDVATSGDAALLKAFLNPPNAILLDLNLPGVDGREVLQQLKTSPITRRIPVIILTSSIAEQDILRAYDLYASGYLQKPVTPQKFATIAEDFEGWWFQRNIQAPR